MFVMQGIANAMYACAALQQHHDALIAELVVAVEQAHPLLSARQLSNVAWALAKLQAGVPQTLQAIVHQLVTHHAAVINAQDVANTLWALARLDCSFDDKMRVCCHASEPVMLPMLAYSKMHAQSVK